MINNRDDLMAVIRDLRSELHEMSERAADWLDPDLNGESFAGVIEMTEDISLGALKLIESPLVGV